MAAKPSPERVLRSRKLRGLTQAQLAELIDGQQSAISMYEHGRLEALSPEKLEILSAVLELDKLPDAAGEESRRYPILACCIYEFCPTNMPLLRDKEILYKPTPVWVRDSSHRHCIFCGKELRLCCHKCGADFQEGACFCAQCGSPIVRADTPAKQLVRNGEPILEWIQRRCRENEQQRAIVTIPDSGG